MIINAASQTWSANMPAFKLCITIAQNSCDLKAQMSEKHTGKLFVGQAHHVGCVPPRVVALLTWHLVSGGITRTADEQHTTMLSAGVRDRDPTKRTQRCIQKGNSQQTTPCCCECLARCTSSSTSSCPSHTP